MFNDYCPKCESKKVPSTASGSRHSSSPPTFFPQIPKQSPSKHDQSVDNQKGLLLYRSGSLIPTPTPEFSDSSCSMCGSKKRRFLTNFFQKRKMIDPKEEASSIERRSVSNGGFRPKSPEKKQKSNVSYFGRTSSSYSRPPSSSSATTRDQKYCEQIVEKSSFDSSSSTNLPRSSTAVVLSQSQPPIRDQKSGKQSGLLKLPLDVLYVIFSHLPIEAAAKIPVLCQSMLNQFSRNHPTFIDSKIIRSRDPLWLNVDSQRLENSYSFSSILPERERKITIFFFMVAFLKAHRKVSILDLTGAAGFDCIFSIQRSISSVNFTELKTLRLYMVNIISTQEIILISRCLEELELLSCRVPIYFRLSSEAGWELKRFTMKGCQGLNSQRVSHIIIEVSTLLRFSFLGYTCIFDLSRSTKLSEAEIKFQNGIINPRSIFHFLNSLKGVQSLTICDTCIKNLRETTSQSQLLLPKLTKLSLTNLSLKCEIHAEQLSTMIMWAAPVLEKLTIEIDSWICCSGFWKSHPFLLDHLTYFKMGPLMGTPSEIEFIGHVFMAASILEKADFFLFYGASTTVRNIRWKERLCKATQKARRVEEMIISLPRSSTHADVRMEGILEHF